MRCIEEGEMDWEEGWAECLCVECHIQPVCTGLSEVLTLTQEQKTTPPDTGEVLHEKSTDGYYREVTGHKVNQVGISGTIAPSSRYDSRP